MRTWKYWNSLMVLAIKLFQYFPLSHWASWDTPIWGIPASPYTPYPGTPYPGYPQIGGLGEGPQIGV